MPPSCWWGGRDVSGEGVLVLDACWSCRVHGFRIGCRICCPMRVLRDWEARAPGCDGWYYSRAKALVRRDVCFHGFWSLKLRRSFSLVAGLLASDRVLACSLKMPCGEVLTSSQCDAFAFLHRPHSFTILHFQLSKFLNGPHSI